MGIYGLAKVAEALEQPVMNLTKVVSGRTPSISLRRCGFVVLHADQYLDNGGLFGYGSSA
ncbi:MAG: hypothetical protein WCK27_28120 [Verrucomicrobiota bacterium]